MKTSPKSLVQPNPVIRQEDVHHITGNNFLDFIVDLGGTALALQAAPYVIATSARICKKYHAIEIERIKRGLPAIPHNKVQRAGGHAGFVLGLAGLVAQACLYYNHPEFTPAIGITNALDVMYEFYIRPIIR